MTAPGEQERDERRPRILDLFSGAGGAAVGYARAGFEVVGVDLRPQPRYPFEFHRSGALTYLRHLTATGEISRFSAVHASPPCQFASRAGRGHRAKYQNLIPEVQKALDACGLPFVIENVPDAARWLRSPVMLCGSMVGIPAISHRYFELSWSRFQLVSPCAHRPDDMRRDHGTTFNTEAQFRDGIGCEWMTVHEARQAIPPAMTQYLGRQLMAHLQTSVAR